jgi:hypothetical protein
LDTQLVLKLDPQPLSLKKLDMVPHKVSADTTHVVDVKFSTRNRLKVSIQLHEKVSRP